MPWQTREVMRDTEDLVQNQFGRYVAHGLLPPPAFSCLLHGWPLHKAQAILEHGTDDQRRWHLSVNVTHIRTDTQEVTCWSPWSPYCGSSAASSLASFVDLRLATGLVLRPIWWPGNASHVIEKALTYCSGDDRHLAGLATFSDVKLLNLACVAWGCRRALAVQLLQQEMWKCGLKSGSPAPQEGTFLA